MVAILTISSIFYLFSLSLLQDSIKLDVDTILYFGKEVSISSIGKYQLTVPFATRQHLISPPSSPPNEWSAPGDGIEHPPTDVDPFAVVTRVVIDENDDENFSFGGNSKSGNCNHSETEAPSSSLMGFSTINNNNNNNNKNNNINDNNSNNNGWMTMIIKKKMYLLNL
ncbi:hypothetical protein ACTA71_006998 [Dictyostelium dimigraforme]